MVEKNVLYGRSMVVIATFVETILRSGVLAFVESHSSENA
jgi:hypothetical protein